MSSHDHEITRIDVDAFFDDYATALLARDAERIAEHYAVPGLILFPQTSIAVTSTAQTAEFFASSFGQYEGVTEIDPEVRVWTATSHSVWVDLTWRYGGRAEEHFCYQLVRSDAALQIGVLTLLG